MKSTKFFIGAGACVLALGSFFATKANSKRFSPAAGYFKQGSASVIASSLSSFTSGFTTTVGSNKVVMMIQSTGLNQFSPIATLYTGASATARKVYHN